MKKVLLKTPEIQVLYYRESLIQSVLADIFLYFCMMLSIWVNYKFIGGNWFGYGFILGSFLMTAIAGTMPTKVFTDKVTFKAFILAELKK